MTLTFTCESLTCTYFPFSLFFLLGNRPVRVGICAASRSGSGSLSEELAARGTDLRCEASQECKLLVRKI